MTVLPRWNQVSFTFIHKLSASNPNVSRIWMPSNTMMILKYRSIFSSFLLSNNGASV